MSILVLHTYGFLERPVGHPATEAFWAAVPEVQMSRENAPGLLRGTAIAFTPDGDPLREDNVFGPNVTPQFHDSSRERISLATLSAWADPESAASYSFHGPHGAAMKNRNEWFRQDHSWPTSVMWWTDDLESVNWVEANARLAQLDADGPTPEAFSFRSMFSSGGEKMRMDNERVKELGGRS